MIQCTSITTSITNNTCKTGTGFNYHYTSSANCNRKFPFFPNVFSFLTLSPFDSSAPFRTSSFLFKHLLSNLTKQWQIIGFKTTHLSILMSFPLMFPATQLTLNAEVIPPRPENYHRKRHIKLPLLQEFLYIDCTDLNKISSTTSLRKTN